MKKHRLVQPVILVLGLALSGMAVAKPQVFKWETEMCRASVRYDDSKVSAAQLDATIKLNDDRLISIYDEKNSQAQDDDEHQKNQAMLQDPRHFIAHPAIETVRQRMIARDQFFYDLQRVKREAARKNDYQLLNSHRRNARSVKTSYKSCKVHHRRKRPPKPCNCSKPVVETTAIQLIAWRARNALGRSQKIT